MQTETETESTFKVKRPDVWDFYHVVEEWHELKARWFSRKVYWRRKSETVVAFEDELKAKQVAAVLNGEPVNALKAMRRVGDNPFKSHYEVKSDYFISTDHGVHL